MTTSNCREIEKYIVWLVGCVPSTTQASHYQNREGKVDNKVVLLQNGTGAYTSAIPLSLVSCDPQTKCFLLSVPQNVQTCSPSSEKGYQNEQLGTGIKRWLCTKMSFSCSLDYLQNHHPRGGMALFFYLVLSSLKHCPCACLTSQRPLPHNYIKMNSKWIKDLIIRPKTIKTREENIGLNFYDLELGSGLFNMTPETEAIKEYI